MKKITLTNEKLEWFKFVYETIIIIGTLTYLSIAVTGKIENHIIHGIYGILVCLFPIRHIIRFKEKDVK